MENQWFYAVNDTQHGPVRVEDLYQTFVGQNALCEFLV